MYLSNRDIKWAIEGGRLIVVPKPEEMEKGYDETSIDLHLDHVREAQVWDIDALLAAEDARGSRQAEVKIGRFNWASFSDRYLIAPPEDELKLVYRRGR